MSEELKPCPSNCGASPSSILGELDNFYIRCPCGWEGPCCTTELFAIKAWNKRTPPEYKHKNFKEYWGNPSVVFRTYVDKFEENAARKAFSAARKV